jgi:acetyltransferase-like isoleucine patch superfamily enzyme
MKPESEKLLLELREMLDALQARSREEWDRSLPLGDCVSDRWRRARALGFGEGTSLYDSCLVFGEVRVGVNVWIGPFTILDGSGGLEIGDGCTISAGVHVYTHDSIGKTLSGGTAAIERAPTRIGARCYIGPHSVIAKGVTLGEGCVIGAHSLVLADIPPGRRAFGAPCKVVGDAT